MAIALLALSLCASARADRLDRARFSVFYEPADAGRAAVVARLFAETVTTVEAALGARVPAHVDVHLVSDDARFDREVAQVAGDRPPAWALAVALPEADEVVIRAARLETGTPDDLPTTLAHEVAHLALAPVGPTLPRWLDEGLAMWTSGRKLTRDERRRLGAMARSGALPRLADLSRAFPRHQAKAGVAYLVSLAFVEMIERDLGPDDVRRVIARLSRGETLQAALGREGAPLDGLEIVLRDELARAWSPLDEFLSSGTLLGVASILVIIAFARARRRRRRLLVALDAAEAAPQAPPEPPSMDERAGGCGGSCRLGGEACSGFATTLRFAPPLAIQITA